MNHKFRVLILLAPLACVCGSLAQVPSSQTVKGHVPSVVKNLHLVPVDRLPAAQHLDLVILILPLTRIFIHRAWPMFRWSRS